MRAGIRSIPATYRVEVLVHAPAERLRPQLGRWAEITEVDAQTCELRMTTDALAWPAMALGAAGAEFEVREPRAGGAAARLVRPLRPRRSGRRRRR